MKQEVSNSKTPKTLAWFNYAVAVILVLLPFHALFTVWAASHFHHFDLIRIWKELLLIPLAIGALFYGLRQKTTRQWLQQSWLVSSIAAYLFLLVVTGLWGLHDHNVNTSALLYGWLIDGRFLVFFVVCTLLSGQTSWLKNHWRPLLLWPALLVICFGFLQQFALPADFLHHFGYSPTTIPAYQTVDQKKGYVRLQSTLRGPNPLGAYLVLVISALAVLALYDKQGRRYWGSVLAVGLIVLFFSYSRSAWLGAATSLALLAWWTLKSKRWRKQLLLVSGILLVIAGTSTWLLRHNDRFQNTFFHTDEHSKSADSSNFDRSSALKYATLDVIHRPFGLGPGTAGPASVRNNHRIRIAENYYLQVGQEVGILGLALFIGINVLLAIELWRINDELSLILLVSLAGLTLVNMLSHAWADDTLSLIWWGLAGISLGAAKRPVILPKSKRKANK